MKYEMFTKRKVFFYFVGSWHAAYRLHPRILPDLRNLAKLAHTKLYPRFCWTLYKRKNDRRNIILLQSFKTEGGPSAVKNQAGERMMTEQNQNLEWDDSAGSPSGSVMLRFPLPNFTWKGPCLL